MSVGRARALLFLSIAWLLAHSSNGVSMSDQLRSLYARDYEQQPAAPAPASALSSGQQMLQADQDATRDFVRRCTVVVTVSDDKFLPVEPLDRFCQTTDAAMECRLKVGERLKRTHARQGDMGRFCAAVYDWFQEKYGNKCPNQCRKLQCRSTCMWLDAKRNLNTENEQIKANMTR